MKTTIKLIIGSAVLLYACQQPAGNGETDIQSINSAYRSLAMEHCSSCHKFPEPDLVDLATWRNYVLPRMGYFYGIYPSDSVRAGLIEEGAGGEMVLAASIFPEKSQLDSLSWWRIQQYYYHNAPESFESITHESSSELDLFKIRKPGLVLSPPSSTLVSFTDGELLVGDAHTGALYFLDRNLELANAARVREGAVNVHASDSHWWVTVMGSFSPSDAPEGLIVKLPKNREGAAEVVLSGLQRPVDAVYEDFNQDGYLDILVCEFGKWTGSLSLYLGTADQGFRKMVVDQRSGATRAESRDVNGDGKPDIIALFGQGNEALEAYINQGDGSFERQQLLSFNPSNGSSYFGLLDLDDDGDEDLIYTAGDNADYLPILKPYHGIYLFENQGDYQFVEKEFIPLNGAYKALPADYDGDGDLDIAAISFFPDYQGNPNEGFVYFEKGPDGFLRKSFENLNLGRWISLDQGDIDGDGDLDLILGSLAFETVPVQQELESNWINRGIPCLVLENTLR